MEAGEKNPPAHHRESVQEFAMQMLARFLKDQSGATAIEYGLIAACISVAIITVATNVGSKLNSTFTQVQSALK
jgi:pilus assembly protein Flp/PilA